MKRLATPSPICVPSLSPPRPPRPPCCHIPVKLPAPASASCLTKDDTRLGFKLPALTGIEFGIEDEGAVSGGQAGAPRPVLGDEEATSAFWMGLAAAEAEPRAWRSA